MSMLKEKIVMMTPNTDFPNVTEMRINGEIGSTWWDDVIESEFLKELDSVTTDTIKVIVNSPGGEVFAGFSIYNNLKSHKAKIEVEIMGLAGSVASVVAMAGDVVRMPKTACIMIHNPWTPYTSGEASDLRSRAAALDSMKDMAISAYLTKAKITKEEISGMMDETVYLTAEEALEKGFIDEIIDYGEGVQVNGDTLKCAGAQFKMSALRNFPKEKFLSNKEKIGGSEEMNKNKLMQEHPELFKEIVSLGIMQERERLQAIDKLPVLSGTEEMVMNAKYSEMATAPELALKLLEESTKAGKKHMENLKEDMEPGKEIGTVKTEMADEERLVADAVAKMRGGN